MAIGKNLAITAAFVSVCDETVEAVTSTPRTGRSPRRMRDLSRLNVAQHERPAQVFLLANAHDRMGRDSAANNDLRRPRTSPLAVAGGYGGAGGGSGRVSENAPALPAKIQQFVQAMPAIDIERHALKRQLAAQFGRRRDHDQVHAVEPGVPAPGDRGPKAPER